MPTGPNLPLLPWLKPSWLAKVEVKPHPDLPDPCLIWHGGTNGDRPLYGKLRIDGKMWYLHRYAFEQATGITLDGHHGHHLCYRTLCFQPAHIGRATFEENCASTYFKPVCPLSDDDLLALYDISAWYYKHHGVCFKQTPQQ